MAYFTVLPTTVMSDGLPKKLVADYPAGMPGFLLAKLALHVSLRGSEPKLGPELLADALRVLTSAADQVGGRVVVVDTANATAHAFYEALDFSSIDGSNRLVMKMSAARDALAG